MKSIYNKEFAYFIGNFVADGSFYKDSSGYRFEFNDGSLYKNELSFSLEHLSKIKRIVEKFFDVKLPKIRRRDQKYVLSFRNIQLTHLFLDVLYFHPGNKSRIIDIPKQYRNSFYEKYFWIGYLDGDGSIARKSKRIAVESMSKKIIESFADYLKKNNIYFSVYESKRKEEHSYVLLIRSISFKDFAKKVGFDHPLKSKLLKQKLLENEFYNKNKIDNTLLDKEINYSSLFDNSVFLVNGRDILVKYGYTKYHGINASVKEVFSFMKSKGLKDKEIFEILGKYRFKKSKGSMNSVALPLTFNSELLKLAKFVRIRNGCISFSKSYVKSFDENFEEILNITQNMFDIKPKYTCKNEPLFCSGVLTDLFRRIIK